MPALSLGLAVSVLAATWIAGARFEGMERADSQAIVLIEDVADRQGKYIGQQGSLTLELAALKERVAAIETELALLKVRLELGN